MNSFFGMSLPAAQPAKPRAAATPTAEASVASACAASVACTAATIAAASSGVGVGVISIAGAPYRAPFPLSTTPSERNSVSRSSQIEALFT